MNAKNNPYTTIQIDESIISLAYWPRPEGGHYNLGDYVIEKPRGKGIAIPPRQTTTTNSNKGLVLDMSKVAEAKAWADKVQSDLSN